MRCRFLAADDLALKDTARLVCVLDTPPEQIVEDTITAINGAH